VDADAQAALYQDYRTKYRDHLRAYHDYLAMAVERDAWAVEKRLAGGGGPGARLPTGWLFGRPGSAAERAALRLPALPGWYAVPGLAAAGRDQVLVDGRSHTPKQLADRLRAETSWAPGTPIALLGEVPQRFVAEFARQASADVLSGQWPPPPGSAGSGTSWTLAPADGLEMTRTDLQLPWMPSPAQHARLRQLGLAGVRNRPGWDAFARALERAGGPLLAGRGLGGLAAWLAARSDAELDDAAGLGRKAAELLGVPVAVIGADGAVTRHGDGGGQAVHVLHIPARDSPDGLAHYLPAEGSVLTGDMVTVLTETVPPRLRAEPVQEVPGGVFAHGPRQSGSITGRRCGRRWRRGGRTCSCT
jgi:hypothetical protein